MTTLTPGLLAGLRFVASGKGSGNVEMTPDVLTALLDRIDALERMMRATDKWLVESVTRPSQRVEDAEALRNGGDR